MAEIHPVQWLWSKGNEPIFSNATVLELAGPRLTPATLQNWANRGIVNPAIATKTVKGRRKYTTTQLQQIVLGLQLMENFGIPPTIAVSDIGLATKQLTKELRVDFSSISDFWFVLFCVRSDDRRTTIKTVPLERMKETLQGRNSAIVYPIGAELHKLATRAMLAIQN